MEIACSVINRNLGFSDLSLFQTPFCEKHLYDTIIKTKHLVQCSNEQHISQNLNKNLLYENTKNVISRKLQEINDDLKEKIKYLKSKATEMNTYLRNQSDEIEKLNTKIFDFETELSANIKKWLKSESLISPLVEKKIK